MSHDPATSSCSTKGVSFKAADSGLDSQRAMELPVLAPEDRPEMEQRQLAWTGMKAASKGDSPTKRWPVLKAGVNVQKGPTKEGEKV